MSLIWVTVDETLIPQNPMTWDEALENLKRRCTETQATLDHPYYVKGVFTDLRTQRDAVVYVEPVRSWMISKYKDSEPPLTDAVFVKGLADQVQSIMNQPTTIQQVVQQVDNARIDTLISDAIAQ